MCNLSTGIYDKGKREGFLEGKREGLLEGKREGLLEGKREGLREAKNEGALEMLFSLVKNNLLSIAVAAKQANMDQTVFEGKYRNYISR